MAGRGGVPADGSPAAEGDPPALEDSAVQRPEVRVRLCVPH